MKFYDCKTAPSPRRLRIFLAEKSIELRTVEVDLARGEQLSDAFRKMNPYCTVPVLELDDGTHIAESVAICRYFEAERPSPPLFGVTPAEQGIVEMWIRRIELNLMMPVGMVWIHGSPLTKSVVKKQIPEMAEMNRGVVRAYFKFLDRHLADHDYLAGSDYSMADIIALCTLDFAASLNDLPHSTEQVHLSRWYDAVSSRPSAGA